MTKKRSRKTHFKKYSPKSEILKGTQISLSYTPKTYSASQKKIKPHQKEAEIFQGIEAAPWARTSDKVFRSLQKMENKSDPRRTKKDAYSKTKDEIIRGTELFLSPKQSKQSGFRPKAKHFFKAGKINKTREAILEGTELALNVAKTGPALSRDFKIPGPRHEDVFAGFLEEEKKRPRKPDEISRPQEILSYPNTTPLPGDSVAKYLLREKERISGEAIKIAKHDSAEAYRPLKRMKTGVKGFDALFKNGIPQGSSILVTGGPGTGKTIFCLQALCEGCRMGEKGLYISMWEPEWKIRQHIWNFGWDVKKLEGEGKLMIRRIDPFDITKSLADYIPGDFRPQRIAIDSLSTLASVFSGRENSYRLYLNQLFRLFENLGATSFLVTESRSGDPALKSGAEAFAADGIVFIRREKRSGIRRSTLEILKMRGDDFVKKEVECEIVPGKGLVVKP